MPIHRHSRGFSLLEMMLVLLIMSTLVTIVVVNINGAARRAKISMLKTTMGQLENQLKEYEFTKGAFPTSEEGLIILVEEGYLERVPKDPWERDFQYYSPALAHPYEIISLGPDPDSDEDDMINWEFLED